MASPAVESSISSRNSSTELCKPILQCTAEQLFLEVQREAGETGRISDDLLSALLCLFQGSLHQAFDLLDHGDITRYTCPAGRELYRVRGSGGRFYICLTSSNYCSCPSFVYKVLVKADSLLCKHMLAVQLTKAIAAGKRVCEKGTEGRGEGEPKSSLPSVEEVCVTDEEFGRLLVSFSTSELGDLELLK